MKAVKNQRSDFVEILLEFLEMGYFVDVQSENKDTQTTSIIAAIYTFNLEILDSLHYK